MTTTLYGIKNCDTVKKARRWLDDAGIDHRFHDVRADGLTRDVIEAWIDELGWEPLVNTRGTTWRRLPEPERAALDRDAAAALMLAAWAGLRSASPPRTATGWKRPSGRPASGGHAPFFSLNRPVHAADFRHVYKPERRGWA